MSLIEQAAKRLEELRRAGVDIPDDAPGVDPERQEPTLREQRPVAHAHTMPASEPLEQRGEHPAQSRHIQLDLARLAANGIVTPDAPRTQIADEFRVVKRPLIQNATGKSAAAIKHGNLIMVTSALPGEGKSFTAVNLAMSIAMELDHKVLLVDADVARPSVPDLLGVPAAPGLLDKLLHPELDLHALASPTNVQKLEFMTSGRPHPHATEMLSSDAMTALVHELHSRYPERIVVFDSPPLLPTTEDAVLARHVGQVLFVVAAGSTNVADVKRALPMIEDCPVRLMMLNKLSPRAAGMHGYGYGYGYGYGG